jgi:hypothetical protein
MGNVPPGLLAGKTRIARMQRMRRKRKTWDTDMALQALREAVRKVIEDHRTRGKPLALWRDGKAVWVAADQLGELHEAPSPYRTKPAVRKG